MKGDLSFTHVRMVRVKQRYDSLRYTKDRGLLRDEDRAINMEAPEQIDYVPVDDLRENLKVLDIFCLYA